MPGPPSHKRLPRWVDARKFAQQRVALEGDIAGADLPRLSQAVASIDSPVRAELQFDIDPSRYRILTGSLSVMVSVVCQRCMSPTQIRIESELAVGMVATEEESRQLPRALEPWQVERDESDADLYSVIEDELLLDLPMVVYHDYACIDDDLYSAGDANTAAPEEQKPNPFQVLEQLKSGKKK